MHKDKTIRNIVDLPIFSFCLHNQLTLCTYLLLCYVILTTIAFSFVFEMTYP